MHRRVTAELLVIQHNQTSTAGLTDQSGPTQQAGSEELGLGVNSILGLTEDQYTIYNIHHHSPAHSLHCGLLYLPGLGMSCIISVYV